MADTLKNSLRDYPILANPALDDAPADDQQPLPTIRPQEPPPGQLQPIRQQGSPAAPLPKFQRNPFRQQQEQGLQQSLLPKPSPTGFWGKTKGILEDIGNTAGTIFLGNNVMSGIPNSAQNNALKQGSAIRQLNDYEDQDRQDEQAFNKAQQEQAQQPLVEAETRKANAQADDLENPQPEALQHLETDQGIFAFNPKTKELTPLTFGGKSLMKPAAAPKEISPVQDLQNQILQAEEKGDTGTAKTLQQRLRDLTPNAEASLASQMARFAASQGGQQSKTDTQTRQASFKAFQPALDSGERFNVMAKNYEDAIKNHDQQAMLSLLANHLGMTMGLQKGARLTKDIIHEAQESRPWLQGLAAKFDKDGVLSGVTLTPEQMRQMVDLGRGRFSEDTVKARNEAHYMGSQDDGPDRTPSRSTMNFYLAQTGGDAPKAKQLAAQDGWTVK